MITSKVINGNSMFAQKLLKVAEKYGVEIIADHYGCRFYLANIDSEHTEDDSVNYRFKADEEKFVFDFIYQLDEINSSDLPQDIEYFSDFVQTLKVISDSVYERVENVEIIVPEFSQEAYDDLIDKAKKEQKPVQNRELK